MSVIQRRFKAGGIRSFEKFIRNPKSAKYVGGTKGEFCRNHCKKFLLPSFQYSTILALLLFKKDGIFSLIDYYALQLETICGTHFIYCNQRIEISTTAPADKMLYLQWKVSITFKSCIMSSLHLKTYFIHEMFLGLPWKYKHASFWHRHTLFEKGRNMFISMLSCDKWCVEPIRSTNGMIWKLALGISYAECIWINIYTFNVYFF